MHGPIKLIILLIGVIFVITVINLLVRRRINERNSFLWLAGSLAILVLAAIPDVLDIVARAAGVDYPPTLLFLLSILVILYILLYQSIQISILQEKCRELAQHLAIVNFSEMMRRDQEPGRVSEDGEGVKGAGHEGYAVRSNRNAAR